MIIGLGTDLCDINRFTKVLDRHGERFLTRIFTSEERAYAARRPANFAATLAKRFAAKEAMSKALGTGMSAGIRWRDIGVVRAKYGPPTIMLAGAALKRLETLTPKGMKARIHLSLTDEMPLAQAHVILEAVPL